MGHGLTTGTLVMFADGRPAGRVGRHQPEGFELCLGDGATEFLGMYAVHRIECGTVVLGCVEGTLRLFSMASR